MRLILNSFFLITEHFQYDLVQDQQGVLTDHTQQSHYKGGSLWLRAVQSNGKVGLASTWQASLKSKCETTCPWFMIHCYFETITTWSSYLTDLNFQWIVSNCAINARATMSKGFINVANLNGRMLAELSASRTLTAHPKLRLQRNSSRINASVLSAAEVKELDPAKRLNANPKPERTRNKPGAGE